MPKTTPNPNDKMWDSIGEISKTRRDLSQRQCWILQDWTRPSPSPIIIPAYVTNVGGNTVTKIDLSTFTTVGSALAVDTDPYGITIDSTNTYAYVTNNGDGGVTKINLSTFSTVGSSLAVGPYPWGIAIDSTNTYAYVTNNGAGTVTKINLSTFTTVGSDLAVGAGPYGIACYHV
jgi:DNA-binding beta-propeller fold protein YncE